MLTGGFEKILRVFDMNRLDAPPTEVDKSPGSIRTLTWLHSDQTILSSCTDIGGVRYELNKTQTKYTLSHIKRHSLIDVLFAFPSPLLLSYTGYGM